MKNLGVLLQGYGGGMGDLDPNAILWPSRDVLDTETQKLDAAIKLLAQNQFDSDGNQVNQTQLNRWNSYVNDFHAWDWGPPWLAHVLDATWRDDLLMYQTKFNDFMSEWQQAGVITSVPAFTFKATPPSTLERLANKATQPIADTANAIKWGVIAVGATIVGYVFFLTFQTGKTARALAPVYARNPRRRRRRR